MWFYENVTREEFEKRKDFTEKVMLEAGAEIFDVKLPYEQKTVRVIGDIAHERYSQRRVFRFEDEYYRVDEVLFPEKPFIVIEAGTLEELMNNIMWDVEPFPYDLSDEEISNEVKYSLGILPYPSSYPK
ncbi:MAG: hypothetical protein K2K57_13415 [Oscillospiraceae bacterium]|nr:hypothetical protein [Oscillospiraceae bacterium]